MSAVEGPAPVPPAVDADSTAFWEALAAGKLCVPTCRSCGQRFFPPIPSCPCCGSAEVESVSASGLGRIFSWVTVHRTLDPAFAEEVPYTVVAVDLEEGGRMLGRLLDRGPAGDRVSVRLTPYQAGDTWLPGFVLAHPPDIRGDRSAAGPGHASA